MTKADIVTKISNKTGIEKIAVQTTVEEFMKSVRKSLEEGENVYLRGFGSFVVKKRAQKTGRNISKNTTIIIPEHFIPSFKPAKSFVDKVKKNVKQEIKILLKHKPKNYAKRQEKKKTQNGYAQAQKKIKKKQTQEEKITFLLH
eukprot:TRINITY_DN19053_c0_g1_i1.p1 TRINITY_DN19053_c0_g1~~TRINITY_DN19053_c0_g1_i1.p1  ORF type:complete len:144 (+),score=9.95 TRINITY_DN19053_c0_g1_i1:63-494(+)